MTDRRILVEELLGFLEGLEQRALSWGFYDVSFDKAAVEQALEDDAPEALRESLRGAQQAGLTLEGLLGDMQYRGLLHAVEGNRYRTRFAEAVRLTSRLRQIFRYEDWNSGPPLVSDLKVHLAPRQYPRRDQTSANCWEEIGAAGAMSPILRTVFEAMAIGATGKPVAFSGFQRRAFSRLFRSYGARGTSGTVISAGTGAGKTKAFYVPAFLGIVNDLKAGGEEFTKIIAIYPRNVLLADQLREALSEAAKLAPATARGSIRPMTFGALLGNTPWDSAFSRPGEGAGRYVETREGGNWARVGNGFVVPFLKSPAVPGADLVWRDDDRKSGRTCLYRSGSDTPDVPDGVLRLTRNQIQQHPPDVLFLSLEMLNRELGTADWWKCFGIGVAASKAPRMLLLDEVHSYEGLAGAQAAWVLRRWRHWSRAEDLHIVGLSATLKSPREHLASLCGIPVESVDVCQPEDAELKSEGMEYSLAIKGDPSSGRGLLSTSIQVAMLLARVLTPRLAVQARGDEDFGGDAFYGRKVFGFSDNLDVLNRWLTNLSNAESTLRLAKYRQLPERRPNAAAIPANLRRRMDDAGQVWGLPAALGFNLEQALAVSRCSSQDPGVETASDVIVATASLEVGYDDPEVGATLHHKRPRAMASFVQRKGRAGRRRGTRPWTVLVLSDYGADRWAFQHAERYFQPQIDNISLPMMNPYVLRTQAAMMLIDWIGQRIRSGSPYRFLATASDSRDEPRRNWVAQILRNMLALGPEWKRFEAELGKVLRPAGTQRVLDHRAAIDTIAWDNPRPLLIQAIPSLLRQVEANWSVPFPETTPHARGRSPGARPMPQYVPAATFSELDATEVRISFRDGTRVDEQLGVAHALSETCPGRVSKRYASRATEAGYWVVGSDTLLTTPQPATRPLEDFFPGAIFLDEVDGVRVFQPISVELAHRPPKVLDTTNASWTWSGRLSVEGQGRPVPVLSGPQWKRSVQRCSAVLHRDGSAVQVLRYARRFDYEIRLQRSDGLAGRVSLATQGESGAPVQQAVGFRMRTDGIRLDLAAESISDLPQLDADAMRRLRQPFFHDQVREALDGTVNVFAAEWLSHVSVAALAATAAIKRCSLADAQKALANQRPQAARRVLEAMFGARDVDGDEDGRLIQRITALCGSPEIHAVLTQCEQVLWSEPGAAFRGWLQKKHVATVGQAFRAAAVAFIDDVSEDDLQLDIDFDGSVASIYLTEESPGGVGQIEQVLDFMLRTPERFDEAFSAALAACPRDSSNRNLLSIAREGAKGEGEVADILSAVRAARGFDEAATAKTALADALSRRRLDASRGAVVAVMNRLAVPGSSPDTDAAVTILNRAWDRLGRRLGIELDPRVFAYVCVRIRGAYRRLGRIFALSGQGFAPTEAQVNALVQRLLWGACKDSCRECLDAPSRYVQYGRPSRSLTANWLRAGVPEVDAAAPGNWLARVREQLLQAGAVRVLARRGEEGPTAQGLASLLLEELEAGDIFVPVSVARVDWEQDRWAVTLRLPGGLDAK